ncbi:MULTISPECIES: ATP-binding protein [Calditerrivibrio]|jgi:serine/threonine-protein kinase RsbW|uniref:ATP-binding protein n=2 Tax=Calditerrivibrionaceae TaxID=2945021 RepID=UPI003C7699B9
MIRLELTLPSNIKLLPLIGDMVETFITKARDELGNVDFEDLAFKINLAVTEAIANAIKHGNKEKEELPVKLLIELEKDVLKIEVTDCGEGFRLEKKEVDISKIPENQDSGRGLYIIKKLVDEVSYSYENGEYRFYMTKRLVKR